MNLQEPHTHSVPRTALLNGWDHTDHRSMSPMIRSNSLSF